MSIRVTPLNFLGSKVSPFWGTWTTWPSCHFSRSAWICQNWLYNSRIQERFASWSALNALGGTPLSPGAFSFSNFVVVFLISSHDMWRSSYSITSLCLVLYIKGQSMGLGLLKNLWKCGPNTETFSASVISIYLFGRRICIMVGKVWWLVSPPAITWTLCHASLGLNSMECIFSAWWEDHADFAIAMVLYTASCETLSRSFASDEYPFPIPRFR